MIELKKGDKVILKGFTGIKLGVFEIAIKSFISRANFENSKSKFNSKLY